MEKPLRKLAYTVEQACEAVGLGRNFLYIAMSEGRLRSFKAGRRRLISAKALMEFVESMEFAYEPRKSSTTIGASRNRQ